MASFADFVTVRPLDSHSYIGHFEDAWCIGSGTARPLLSAQVIRFRICADNVNVVPNGGYLTAFHVSVAETHSRLTLSHLAQPNVFSLHLQFLRRTSVGPAHFSVREIKQGARTSTLHVTLSQGDPQPRPCIEGYILLTNLKSESQAGLTLPIPTSSLLYPPPHPISHTELLESTTDDHWALQSWPFARFRKATQHIAIYLPKTPLAPHIVDEWLRFTPYGQPSRWTTPAIPFVCDMFPQMVEHILANTAEPPVSIGARHENTGKETAKFWYPTVALNLDVKKTLPEEGVEWLFVRVQTKVVRGGRLDLEVTVCDEAMQVVALSNHVTLILGSERNLAGRQGEKEKSKEVAKRYDSKSTDQKESKL